MPSRASEARIAGNAGHFDAIFTIRRWNRRSPVVPTVCMVRKNARNLLNWRNPPNLLPDSPVFGGTGIIQQGEAAIAPLQLVTAAAFSELLSIRQLRSNSAAVRSSMSKAKISTIPKVCRPPRRSRRCAVFSIGLNGMLHLTLDIENFVKLRAECRFIHVALFRDRRKRRRFALVWCGNSSGERKWRLAPKRSAVNCADCGGNLSGCFSAQLRAV